MENIRIPWNGWKIVDMIGKGSYGTVYEIERTVGSYTEKAAMKVIPIPPNQQLIYEYQSEGYSDESIFEMCKSLLNDTVNEYSLMRSMNGNRNIVSCDDIAYLEREDSIGWYVYIRMELLTPFFDSHILDTFDEKEVIKLGKDICNALASCEENNVVHRDVKPGNIFISKKGEYKLGDFGVARTLDHTSNATRVGTEKFMAPEVIRREKYGKDVDLYSLGLVLYWLLNDRRLPFLVPGRDTTPQQQTEAYYKRLSGEAIPEPKYGSRALKDVVLKACSYDRDSRFQSADEMIAALENAEGLVKEKKVVAPPPKAEKVVATPKPDKVVKEAPVANKVTYSKADPNEFKDSKTVPKPIGENPKQNNDGTMRVVVDEPAKKPGFDPVAFFLDHKAAVIGGAAALLAVIVAIIVIAVVAGGSGSKDSNAANTINTTIAGKEVSKLTTEKKKKETTTTAPRTTVKTATTKARGGLFSRRTTKKTTKKTKKATKNTKKKTASKKTKTNTKTESKTNNTGKTHTDPPTVTDPPTETPTETPTVPDEPVTQPSVTEELPSNAIADQRPYES